MRVEKEAESVNWNGNQVDFYLMEYASKGDLFDLVMKYHSFKQKLNYMEIPNSSDSTRKQELMEDLTSSPFMPLFMVKQIIKEIGYAVQCLHEELKVAHMDIKLENVMVRENNEMILSDFG